MDRLTALRVFVEVAERGSLTRAAEQLDLSVAMVSRHLAAVEAWLGARLLHRTTRKVSLSDAGQEVLARSRQLLEMVEEVQALTAPSSREPAGRLRVSSSPSFAEAQLTSAVVAFQQQHPRVEVELVVSDRVVDLVEERIDLAVRITNALDESVVALPLAVCRSVLCAAPSYLDRHGHPASPADLAQHPCITHAHGIQAEYRLRRDGTSTAMAVKGALSSNETAVLRQAAVAGGGIAMLPTYYVVDDLRRGALTRLLPEYEPQTMGIHAVYLSRRHQPHALRMLLEWLVQRFGGDVAPWDAALANVAPDGRAPRPRSRRHA